MDNIEESRDFFADDTIISQDVFDEGKGEVFKNAQKLSQMYTNVEEWEELIKEEKKKIKKLEETIIPENMAEIGLKDLTLDNGAKITIKDVIFASISTDRQDKCFKWLKDNGHESIIKGSVNLTFAAGNDSEMQKAIDILEKEGYVPNYKNDVHYQTLNAWAKNIIESEQIKDTKKLQEFKEIFKIYEGKQAKIKQPKGN